MTDLTAGHMTTGVACCTIAPGGAVQLSSKYASSEETAARWGVTPSLVCRWCRAGKIKGAVKMGRDWMIPVTSPRPVEPRQR